MSSDCGMNKPLDIQQPCEFGGKQRRKKFQGGNASKRHRDRVNIEFNNLAKLLPFSQSVIGKLDKSSILRLAVSYIRAKSFFKGIPTDVSEPKPYNNIPSKEKEFLTRPSIQEGFGTLSEVFTQALDGFLLILTEDMKVLFVSETVRDYLGYCQAGIIHENFLQFVNPSDEKIIKSNMFYQQNELESQIEPQLEAHANTLLSEQLMRTPNIGGRIQSVARRKFVCRMKCAFSCSSRFYTAYRAFEFTGHLRRSTIQDGREEKLLNTLVVLGTPAKSSCTSVRLLADSDDKGNLITTDDGGIDVIEKAHNGFRIEPTLRPHISPIPVTSQELAVRRIQTSSCNTTKAKQLPSLIPAELYNRQSYLLAHNIKSYKQNIGGGCPNPPLDSRLSDHSDDSKCSPVASPNLLWKQNRCQSPVYETRMRHYIQPIGKDFSRNEIQNHNDFLIKRFSYERYPEHLTRFERVNDVYEGANMLMNLRYRESSPSPDTISQYRKRSYPNIDIGVPPKRPKSNSPSKNSFNITSLLGMEERARDFDESGDKFVDVCETTEDNSEVPFNDMIHSMSRRLDDTFRKTMSTV